MEGHRRRWPWQGWRLLGGARTPPEHRTLRRSDGLDEAAIGAVEPAEPGGGADLARDFGDLGDPFVSERGRQG